MLTPLSDDIFKKFPRLLESDYVTRSDPDPSYNCAAYTLDIKNRIRWPDKNGNWVTFDDDEPDIQVDMLIMAYEQEGFSQCRDVRQEPGVTRIAIYAKDNIALHVALQRPDRPNGRWFSKLGLSHDIEHDLQDLEDGAYSFVHDVFLCKARTSSRRKSRRRGR